MASAQISEAWTLTVDQSSFGDWVNDAVVEPDGTTTYAGGLKLGNDGPGEFDYAPVDGAIARVTPQGALLWVESFRPAPGSRMTYRDVAVAPSGDIFATGYSDPGGAVTVKYTPAGILHWAVMVTGGGNRIAVDPGGDLWIVGFTSVLPNQSDILVRRITPAGFVVFSTTWNGASNFDDEAFGVAPDGSGGAYVTGRANKESSADVVLLHVDAAGSVTWARTSHTGVYTSRGNDVAVDGAGNAILTGSGNGFPLLMKYDPAGNLLWQRVDEGAGMFVAIDPRGDLISVGDTGAVSKHDPLGSTIWSTYPSNLVTESFAIDGSGEIAVGGAGARVRRVGRDGEILWDRVFGTPGDFASCKGIGFGPPGTVFAVGQSGPWWSSTNVDVVVTRFDEAAVPFCFGDGSGTACPCGNATPAHERAGCASSLGRGGRLTAIGVPSLAADTLVLRGSGMPEASALYFQGTTQVGAGAGVTFGDGLRCAGGTIVRLKTTTNAGGGSQFPAPGDPGVSQRGQISAPGTRTYQVWYRNAATFCTSATFNLTNGVLVTWTN